MNSLYRLLLVLIVPLGLWQTTESNPPPTATPGSPQGTGPTSPIDWFRRADNLTNIRLPGSAPFQMKVIFHALPGIDYTKPGQSTIITGDGTYEETWISPEKWRREVTLGTYHAVEVRADGVRKFQATSDYEPSRVLMLMRALLAPVSRPLLEPELHETRIPWKLDHLTAGKLAYVRIAHKYEVGSYGPEAVAYDFLPNGSLFREEDDFTGLLSSWEDDVPFAGKLVPRRLTVQGAGLGQEMLTAQIGVELSPPSDTPIAQSAGEPAEPNMTLRPVGWIDRPASPVYEETPGTKHAYIPYPVGVKTSVMAVVDRQGTTREVELSGIRVYGQPLSRDDMDRVSEWAQLMVQSAWHDRFHPPLVDEKPCEGIFVNTMYHDTNALTNM
jgi:hypothetical protein